MLPPLSHDPSAVLGSSVFNLAAGLLLSFIVSLFSTQSDA